MPDERLRVVEYGKAASRRRGLAILPMLPFDFSTHGTINAFTEPPFLRSSAATRLRPS